MPRIAHVPQRGFGARAARDAGAASLAATVRHLVLADDRRTAGGAIRPEVRLARFLRVRAWIAARFSVEARRPRPAASGRAALPVERAAVLGLCSGAAEGIPGWLQIKMERQGDRSAVLDRPDDPGRRRASFAGPSGGEGP
ncbi:MAG: hypothetical protein JO048_12320 [Methylobacteriaceae bacterium]|nr:hypothetical protein [Methylobacteriaceae bacterium]